MEVERNYPDLLIIPKETDKNYGSVMIEFKYLKKKKQTNQKLNKKKQKSKFKKYAQLDEIKTQKSQQIIQQWL